MERRILKFMVLVCSGLVKKCSSKFLFSFRTDAQHLGMKLSGGIAYWVLDVGGIECKLIDDNRFSPLIGITSLGTALRLGMLLLATKEIESSI